MSIVGFFFTRGSLIATDERLILPTKYLDELRDFPDDELSIVKAMDTVRFSIRTVRYPADDMHPGP